MMKLNVLKKIKLYNRYCDDVHLEPISENKYILKCPGEYIRVGYHSVEDFEKHNYSFIDPPGGPFISVGKELDGKIVSKIGVEDNEWIIEFEEG